MSAPPAPYLPAMPANPPSPEQLAAALRWQAEMGADECLDETFHDRTAQPPPAPPPATEAAPPPAVPKGASAEALAASASDLPSLREAIIAHDHPLKEGAKNPVFADGNPAARVMIVGEAPGRDEDVRGLPFVGRSGQLMDRMLHHIGLHRDAPDPAKSFYVTNVLPWRPLGNRAPAVDEAVVFLPFLRRHIELAAPEIVVTMGNASTKALLDVTTGITRMRGNWAEVEIGGRRLPVLPTLHPAYLLRRPADKDKVWADLLSLEERMGGLA